MNGFAYIGRASCGHVVAAISGNSPVTNVAKALSEWIRDGLTVENVTNQYVRENFGCTCPKPVQLTLLEGSGC
jgi:hypothetical protein